MDRRQFERAKTLCRDLPGVDVEALDDGRMRVAVDGETHVMDWEDAHALLSNRPVPRTNWDTMMFAASQAWRSDRFDVGTDGADGLVSLHGWTDKFHIRLTRRRIGGTLVGTARVEPASDLIDPLSLAFHLNAMDAADRLADRACDDYNRRAIARELARLAEDRGWTLVGGNQVDDGVRWVRADLNAFGDIRLVAPDRIRNIRSEHGRVHPWGLAYEVADLMAA